MRVVAGAAKGRKLSAPPGRAVRPILDRVKVALFSWLEARGLVAGARVLDLYAGAGSLGIEALSRGAAAVVFVELDPRVAACLQENLSRTGLDRPGEGALSPGAADPRGSAVEVRCVAAEAAIAALGNEGRRFDLIFFDPPYARSGAEGGGEVEAEMARAAELLAPEGLLLLRFERVTESRERLGELVRIDQRQWGRNVVAFYRRQPDGNRKRTE